MPASVDNHSMLAMSPLVAPLRLVCAMTSDLNVFVPLHHLLMIPMIPLVDAGPCLFPWVWAILAWFLALERRLNA
jgi:hypothetical protein